MGTTINYDIRILIKQPGFNGKYLRGTLFPWLTSHGSAFSQLSCRTVEYLQVSGPWTGSVDQRGSIERERERIQIQAGEKDHHFQKDMIC